MKVSIFLDNLEALCKQKGCTLGAALNEARHCGIEYIDLNAAYNGVDELLRLLKKTDLKIGGMYAIFDFAHGLQLEKQQQVVMLAKTIGALNIMAVPGFANEGDDHDTVLANMVEGLKSLVSMAAEQSLRVCIEDHGFAKGYYGTAEEMLYLVENVPGLQVNFDTGNFIIHDADVLKSFELLKNHIIHVHMKDWSFAPLLQNDEMLKCPGCTRKLYPAPIGNGELPIAEVVRRLSERKYNGICTIEQFGTADQLMYMRRGAKWLVNIID